MFLKDINVKFRTESMADNMPRLSAFNSLPQDNTAPVLEIREQRKAPVFYDHRDLFDKTGLKKDFLLSMLGEGPYEFE